MKALLPAVIIALLPAVVHGQVEQGAVPGRVFDQLGAAVPGASVTVTDANFGRTISGTGERRLQLGLRLGF